MPDPIGRIIDTPNGDAKSGVADPTPDTSAGLGATVGNDKPEILAGYDSPETARVQSIGNGPRKRGRPRGSKNLPTETQAPDSLIDLTAILLNLHAMGAAFLSVRELELEESEAKQLSEAIKNVAQYYPHHLDHKKIAILNLVIVAGGVYGTRLMAYRARTASERKSKTKLVTMPSETIEKTNGAPKPAEISSIDLWGGFVPTPIESDNG